MALIYWIEVLTQRGIAVVFGIVFALLQGCASGPPVAAKVSGGLTTELPSGFFVPSGTFSKSTNDSKPPGATAVSSTAANTPAAKLTTRAPLVMLYASPSTNAYFATGGLDAKVSLQLWTTFLHKYKIPYQVLTSVELLEKAQPGVVLLPSLVALSEREKQAVIGFRAKGGGVLASWLTGVRNENGEWRGFGFMEDALGAKVVGNTEAQANDIYLMPYGDSPVTHFLPAGMRIWLERAKEWYPLRLKGRNQAAQFMDWSRTFAAGRAGSAIVFDERSLSSGPLSRSVVLGYPERLWLSADPKPTEAIAHNALMWLLRQPGAYINSWPFPYGSASLWNVEARDVITDNDVALAKSLEDAGGRATYFLLSESAGKSAKLLNKLQTRGHDLAYLGDRFDGFRGQSADVQSKRLDTMRSVVKGAGLEMPADAGFNAPTNSYDKITESLLHERAFGYFVASMDASDARRPFIDPRHADDTKPMVVLPLTQRAAEQLLDDEDPAEGLAAYLDELELTEKMAGLSIVTIPNQSLLSNDELSGIFAHLKARRDRMWLATAGQVAKWWRERNRVSARLEPGDIAPQLTVTIKGEAPLMQAVTISINLPEAGNVLRLESRSKLGKLPRVVHLDTWRSALVLEGMAPGEYQWDLFFDRKPN
jgi:hypothetical protein